MERFLWRRPQSKARKSFDWLYLNQWWSHTVVLGCKEGKVPKNWCLQTVVLEKTPESPLNYKEIKPVNLKRNQLWIFGRTDAEAEAPVFWSTDANSWLTRKVSGAGKDRGQKEKRASEDEMAGWHHWCSRHELGQTSGDGEGQGGLACCSPWSLKESDTTGWLNNNNHLKQSSYLGKLSWLLVIGCP